MKNLPDYYAILQVHLEAEKEVIDAAYRKLAAKYHPDVNKAPDAGERMKQINAAYEVLSDPVKRAQYDAARGVVPPPEAAGVGVVSRPRYLSLVILAGLVLLAVMVVKLGPRFALLLAVFGLLAWLLLALGRSKAS